MDEQSKKITKKTTRKTTKRVAKKEITKEEILELLSTGEVDVRIMGSGYAKKIQRVYITHNGYRYTIDRNYLFRKAILRQREGTKDVESLKYASTKSTRSYPVLGRSQSRTTIDNIGTESILLAPNIRIVETDINQTF